jgi:uncharacterized protein YfeS
MDQAMLSAMREEAIKGGVNRPKNASAISLALMKEDWFWNSLDENSPFGNDQGADASSAFRSWRSAHPAGNPVDFARELLEGWGTGFDKWNQAKANLVLPIPNEAFFTVRMGDEALIAIAFAQLVDEGYISPELHGFALKAIHNEKLPNMNNFMVKGEREDRLRKMESVLEKSPTAPTKSDN